MKAIILAAGRGSRMGTLTHDKPKCLSLVNGKPLIEHQIHSLSSAGIKNIAITTGYKEEMLKNYGVYQFYNSRWAETNMVASLLCAKEWLDHNDCIISYSDIFYGSKIVKDLIACREDIGIAYDLLWLDLWSKRFENPLHDAETFRFNEHGYITEIGQKAQSLEDIQGQYMGLLKFSKGTVSTCLNRMSNINFNRIDMTSFLSILVTKNFKIKAIPNSETWGECDTEQDLRIMNE